MFAGDIARMEPTSEVVNAAAKDELGWYCI